MTRPPVDRWFVTLAPRPEARLRLLCFPYTGAGAFACREGASRLPGWVELSGVRFPGRETRVGERPSSDLPALIRALMEVLPARLDLPCALFGHSLGAIVAFEVARAMCRQGSRPPVHLFASARQVERLRTFDGTSEAVLSSPELMRLFVPVLRADFQIDETYSYVPSAPLPCPISALWGSEDPITTHEEAEGWREHTSASFKLHTIPGGHFFIHTAQDQFLGHLVRDLHSARVAWPPGAAADGTGGRDRWEGRTGHGG